MATVTLGNLKFTWKGAYNAGTAYAIDDVVSYNGSSYVAKTATTGNLPTVTANWDLMSQAGTNGTNGTDLTTTSTTQGDLVYRDGSGLQRLGAGTSGHFLKTQGTGANPVWAEAGGKFESALFHATSNQMSMSSGAWYTVTMDTIKTNEITNASLSSNDVSLPAGTYFSQSSVPFYRTDDYGSRVLNVTDGNALVLGNQGHSWLSPNDATSPNSMAFGRFTLSGTKTVRLQYKVSNGNSQAGSYTGVSNHWLIWKVA